MESRSLLLVQLGLLVCWCWVGTANNKYSKAANQQDKEPIKNYASLASPFRMQKINLVWEKARLKMELTEKKLSKLYSELKIQDKDELTLKKLKAESGDKDGVKEAEVRKKFSSILNSYGLGGRRDSEEASASNSHHKQLFKDKKLQLLWDKAEKSGLNPEELVTLQEEFVHHQEKVDEYHQLMDMAGSEKTERFNTIRRELEEDLFDIRQTNELKKKSQGIKKDYDRLHRLALNQGEYEGFNDPKVHVLWKLALESQFEESELESLKVELSHYEKRLEKVKFLQSELMLVDKRKDVLEDGGEDDEKTEGRKLMDRKLGKSLDEIKKLHQHLEGKIMSRHSEF